MKQKRNLTRIYFQDLVEFLYEVMMVENIQNKVTFINCHNFQVNVSSGFGAEPDNGKLGIKMLILSK